MIHTINKLNLIVILLVTFLSVNAKAEVTLSDAEFDRLLSLTNYIEPATKYYNLTNNFAGFYEEFNIETKQSDESNVITTYFTYNIYEELSKGLVRSNTYYTSLDFTDKSKKVTFKKALPWIISGTLAGVLVLNLTLQYRR